jgi:hypothetical protein
VRSITTERRKQFFESFRREALHLEMRETYGTEAERPYLEKWKAGEKDDANWAKPWLDQVRAATAAGRSYRRARLISEPMSDYHRWIKSDSHLFVEAGEDIRWVPRRLVSAVALPGNDFWLFDEETAIFTVFAGDGNVAERQLSTDPAVVRLCKSAFEAVWAFGIADHEYRPA